MHKPAYPGALPHWLARIVSGLLATVLCGVAAAAVPPQEPRHALVVGNAGYASAPLLNSVNDATAVAKVLEKAGFTVDLKLNATQKQMQDAVTTFGDRHSRSVPRQLSRPTVLIGPGFDDAEARQYVRAEVEYRN